MSYNDCNRATRVSIVVLLITVFAFVLFFLLRPSHKGYAFVNYYSYIYSYDSGGNFKKDAEKVFSSICSKDCDRYTFKVGNDFKNCLAVKSIKISPMWDSDDMDYRYGNVVSKNDALEQKAAGYIAKITFKDKNINPQYRLHNTEKASDEVVNAYVSKLHRDVLIEQTESTVSFNMDISGIKDTPILMLVSEINKDACDYYKEIRDSTSLTEENQKLWEAAKQ
ncbi:hypothetical protein [Serratia sp. Se-RSBMAAmG]|uniref:hypothetical protein n=1 Tax=Serratia sp. Se-RSBMAAmG TaxID=3043305 RepID=UPI0024AF687B|nr:hypothetical protein [Serratia sp. Se-RSBMAAmG]MDI6975929.1 hypothetical protein [Serratia sp. Se-RSBMAAmG]